MLATLTATAQRGDIDGDLQYAEYLVNNGKSALAYPELNKIILRITSAPSIITTMAMPNPRSTTSTKLSAAVQIPPTTSRSKATSLH